MTVSIQREGEIAIVTVDNPPVNACETAATFDPISPEYT